MCQKKQEEENEGENSSLTQMDLLKLQVENTTKEGKTDADSIAKIETLKGILILNILKGTTDVSKRMKIYIK